VQALPPRVDHRIEKNDRQIPDPPVADAQPRARNAVSQRAEKPLDDRPPSVRTSS
jgi:hypothetical protein